MDMTIIYITRDIERALGKKPIDNYCIISNSNEYSEGIKKQYPNNIFLIKDNKQLDTFDLLNKKEVQEIIEEKNASILVFQNNSRIERLCEEKKWKLLNPKSSISKEAEEKISQITFLKEHSSLLPNFKVLEVKNILFENKKFVLQFNHSHTGEGTYIIESEEQLNELKKKFPERLCRITDFINGPVFTVNIVVGKDEIIIGNTSYQITGIYPFTSLLFSTIGNDWSIPHLNKYNQVLLDIDSIGKKVGQLMKDFDWKGLFGIDIIYDEKNHKTYLLEINARQAASVTYESTLQGDNSIFEAHIKSLLNEDVSQISKINNGSQIIKRVNDKNVVNVNKLLENNFNVIKYQNYDFNKELFRIQSEKSIIEDHNKLNNLGKLISSCIN